MIFCNTLYTCIAGVNYAHNYAHHYAHEMVMTYKKAVRCTTHFWENVTPKRHLEP